MTHPPLRVSVQDLRTARICLQGARPWFRRHGFDWGGFVAEGIDAARLEATGDAVALRVVAAARARVGDTSRADHVGAAPPIPTRIPSTPFVPADTTPADPTPEPHNG